MAPIYLDASAAYKLIVEEAESKALRRFLSKYPEQISSRLIGVELARAVARLDEAGAERETAMKQRLKSIYLLALDDFILTRAGKLGPKELRSLDAIHLASALTVPDLVGMVVYDRRLAEAAGAMGIRVFAPTTNSA